LELFDTHAHLDDEQFREDLDAVLQRAIAAGVTRILSVATTAASSALSVALAEKHSVLRATVGIQPNNVAAARAGDWDEVQALVNWPGVVALGETGLDRHWDYTPLAQQEDYFARHLALARQHRLPVVIHCRDAEADVVRMLREEYNKAGPLRGVMHSFTGSRDSANDCMDMGLYISFAGMLTYKNAEALRAVAFQLPRERLLVETDSPYLAPVPLRGRRNEPAFVQHTLECLAQGHGIDAAAMAAQTTQNAQQLFGLW
jgi:TatD DNase family protein